MANESVDLGYMIHSMLQCHKYLWYICFFLSKINLTYVFINTFANRVHLKKYFWYQMYLWQNIYICTNIQVESKTLQFLSMLFLNELKLNSLGIY